MFRCEPSCLYYMANRCSWVFVQAGSTDPAAAAKEKGKTASTKVSAVHKQAGNVSGTGQAKTLGGESAAAKGATVKGAAPKVLLSNMQLSRMQLLKVQQCLLGTS